MRLIRKAISLAAVLVPLFWIAGCSKNISGTYVHDKDKRDYMELHSDGTLFLRVRGSGVSGKYSVESNVITLMIDGKPSIHCKLHDGVMVDDAGEAWTRGEYPGYPGEDTPAKTTAVVPNSPQQPAKTTAIVPNSPQQNELAAVSAVRTLNTTEMVYQTAYPADGYATNLTVLGRGSPPVDCSSAGEINSRHSCLAGATLGCASAWCIWYGYRLNISSPDKAPPIADYTITATPIDAGNGGKNFCSMSDGVIRLQTGPPLSSPVPMSECRTWPPLR